MDGIGEPRILRYARELIRMANMGDRHIKVWHIPSRIGRPACQQHSPRGTVEAVYMFEEPPSNMCTRCRRRWVMYTSPHR